MKTIVMFIVIVVINTTAFAGSCIKKSEVCTDNSTRTISGTQVTRCWNYRSIYSCPSEDFTDYCAAISSVQGCAQINSVCTKTNSNGGCDAYENTYSCGSKLGNIDNIIYLTSNYTITTDSLDKSACTEPENNKNCTLTAQTCTQGPETRNINGLDVYKDCWKYDYKYSCLGNVQYDNCDGLNSNCTYLSKNCIAPGSKGNCLTAERSYQCNKESAGPSSMVCQGQIYCINGDCQQAKTIPDTGLVKGLTYLGLIKKAGDEFNADDLSIFAGGGKSCHKDIAGFNNCCADDGWGQDIGLATCSADEKTLATQSSNGQCHLVGTYCSDKSAFGICLEKRKSYCCFPSKLGRIIQEQGRPQVNKGWGSPQAPACEGLTIEQLQSLDFTKIDLKEIFPDVGKAISIPDGKQVIDTMATRVKGHYAK